MKPGPARQAFQPVWGVERHETITRFLYAILISVVSIEAIMTLLRLWQGWRITDGTNLALAILVCLQLPLLYMVQRGYANQAALILIISSWLAVTYLNWNAAGVRDIAIYLYFVVLLMAALLTNWGITFALALLSIV